MGWSLQERAEYAVPRERARALYKMAELLCGSTIDRISQASDTGIDPWLVRWILNNARKRASDLRGVNAARGIVIPIRSTDLVG
jgi:hypothetical protein